MTQAKPRFATFEEYLSYSDRLEGRFYLIDGELVELPPEAEPNNYLGRYLMVALISRGLVPLRLIVNLGCEVQVPVLERQDPANRFPDLVLLREEHLALTKRRLTITLDMPPPRLIVEIVSPGKTNRERDYISKRAQYAAIGVAEYWIIDPQSQVILVLTLVKDSYQEIGQFRGNDRLISPTFPDLTLTAEQVLQPES